ncbi:MAG: zeta toxin family protein [Bacteroidota bacterium]
MPDLYIITGSNGAGKSSVGPQFLPAHILSNHQVFDGDLLYLKKRNEFFAQNSRAPKEAHKRAAEFVKAHFEELVEDALLNKQIFVYEGHFINHATWDIPKRFKDVGYNISMLFLGLHDPDLSEARVLDRTKYGGHFVDRATIEANFTGNLEKLEVYWPLIDSLTIFDTSGTAPIVLAQIEQGKLLYPETKENLPVWFTKYLPSITAFIAAGRQ